MGRPKAAATISAHQLRRQANQEQFENRAHDAVWRPANLRMKRVVVTGRKGPLTPIPSWKLYENPFYEGILAAVQPEAAASGREGSVSARRLAATLWGMQDLPLFSSSPGVDLNPKSMRSNKQSQRQSHVHRQSERREDNTGSHFSSTNKRHASIGMEAQKQSMVVRKSVNEGKHGALESVTTSHELLKVLGRIRNLEEENTLSTSLVAGLRLELDRARQRIQELELQLKAVRKEIDSLQRKFVDERAQLRAREQERIRSAVQGIEEELEEEKKIQRRLETTNKKLVKEIADANLALTKALQGLDREKKARELMEDVCDELAREIGEDKAEFEELKRESAKVKEEVEEERKMLQVAEVWREERVQMKLAEARHDLEEKTVALNKLRCELETFLESRTSFKLANNPLESHEIRKAERLWDAVDALHLHHNRTSFEQEKDEAGLLVLEKNSDFIDLNNDALNRNLLVVSNDNAHELNESDAVHISSSAITMTEPKGGGTKPNKPKTKVKLLDRFRRHHHRDDGRKERVANGVQNEWKREPENQQKETKTAVVLYANGFAKEEAKQVDACNTEDGAATVGLCKAVNGTLDDKTIDHTVSEQFKDGATPMAMASNLGADQVSRSTVLWRSNSVGKQACNLQGDDEPTLINQPKEGRSSQPYSASKALPSFAQQHVRVHSLPVFQRRGWSSMDAGNPHTTRGLKASIEWPKNTRDNSLRAKLLEAKMESQQGKFKAGRSIQ
ncbi:hypothetical protein O6H91_Y532900 [Diphasiastrum complanatum]|nr:hypothetical protein O6H91_Y532900 [Diphasiastrum complanatum]